MREINKAVLRCATQLTQIPAERSRRNIMDNLSLSSLRRHCGELALEKQHVSFSNMLHHPFRYHHGWNAPILQFFNAGNESHSSPSMHDNKSKCQRSMIYNPTFK